MTVYLRIEGLDREDLLDADTDHDESAGHDLADRVFAAVYHNYPGLYGDLDGVVPVLHPEHDPRLLETTPVFAARDETPDNVVNNEVSLEFGDDRAADLDASGSHATTARDEALIQLTCRINRDSGDGDDDRWQAFTAGLPDAESDRAPVRIGTLYHDGTEVVRVRFDALDDQLVSCDDCGRRGPRDQIDNHDCSADDWPSTGVLHGSEGP
jgi:hypothetical protein